ncbi:hypothetical protein WBJ53_26095 [Spirosoma sp. SC4-14]|uniref:hypothetical protein n=1 Tax=Spirosoma sp. SC4-14 TaxID=3128900 RepID=UPI0030D604FF
MTFDDLKKYENGKIKFNDLVDEESFKKGLDKLNETATQLGPGERILNVSESYSTSIMYLSSKLCSLPNAFDPVTGKLNRENENAVFLYHTIQAMISYSQFPFIWKKVE